VLDADGNLESREVNYHFLVEFQNGATLEPGINAQQELLVKPFVINRRRNIVIPPGVYKFHEYWLKGQTDRSRRLLGNIELAIGPFYTGYKHTYILGGTLRLNHQFNTSVGYTHNNINLAEGHFKTDLLNLRVNYSFSTAIAAFLFPITNTFSVIV